ncbi:hypothetical protein EYW49_22105 [Siculibacillus lacustris]|uniref:Uncharacterized protein n=1 Tax=Siculibacillus lacustris TaxID=1549641 RepID=A0A4Q9VEU5_9HYPH|nr:hypothetical protein EYW49_22105 [Siculibacillus lacustris]
MKELSGDYRKRCPDITETRKLPLSEASKEIGIQEYILRTLCETHRVPRPNSAYWKARASGREGKQVRLTATADPSEEIIILDEVVGMSLEDRIPHFPVRETVTKARERPTYQPPLRPVLPPLETPHRLIAATVRDLRKRQPNSDTVQSSGEGRWQVSVSADLAERVIHILDRIVRTLSDAGYRLEFWSQGLLVRGRGELLTFKLREHSKRVPHTLTEEEQENERRRKIEFRREGRIYELSSWYPKYDYISKGVLSLTMAQENGHGVERIWKDGKTSLVEDTIAGLPDAVDRYLLDRIEDRHRHERYQRNSERRSRCADRARRRIERESQRKKVLDDLVEITTEANRLRQWLNETSSWPEAPSAVEFNRLVEWSRRRLSELESKTSAEGISTILRDRNLFPEVDPLVDPPEDLIME